MVDGQLSVLLQHPRVCSTARLRSAREAVQHATMPEAAQSTCCFNCSRQLQQVSRLFNRRQHNVNADRVWAVSRFRCHSLQCQADSARPAAALLSCYRVLGPGSLVSC
jgi:hypothetical protein